MDISKKILNIMISTKEYWTMPKKTLFHNTISVIISQKITFHEGREIRQKLFEKLGKYDIVYDEFKKLGYDKLKEIGLSEDKIKCIDVVLKCFDKDIDDLAIIRKMASVKGIGPWTLKSLYILSNLEEYNNIFLIEDYWIRKQIKILYGLNKVPTEKEIKKMDIMKAWKNNESNVSRFLWRLKSDGASAILNNITLERHHFL